ncbi:MAG: hypothetical protein QOI35_2076 [Cryptosporangiaceae bacterium]|nr:hypothetical protein [Cryptosporangiaceae bacterium]
MGRRGASRVALLAALAAGGALVAMGLPGAAGAARIDSVNGRPLPAASAPRAAVKATADPFVVMAAGDISTRCGASAGWACPAERTARLVEAADPTFVLPLGDNQYDYGTLGSYERFYDTTWGRFKSITRPVPGNHESYDPAGSTSGYRDYFGDRATPDGTTYYSYDRGDWHFVALDSNLSMADISEQNAWLENDLSNNSRDCVLAYWHHPQFSSGSHGLNPLSRGVWRTLYAHHADLILNGHDHLYERFAPQDPSGDADPEGIREFVVGTGGATLRDFVRIVDNSQVRRERVYGVLKLTLSDSGYQWGFVRDNGSVTDQGTANCH